MKRLAFVVLAAVVGYAVARWAYAALDISRTVDALRWERGEMEKWRRPEAPGKVLG